MSSNDYYVKSIRCAESGFSSPHFENSTAIQLAVFVGEQRVPVEKVLANQYEATHYVLYLRVNDAWEPAACARVRHEFRGRQRTIKIERVAVLPDFRGRSLARFLLEKLIEEQTDWNHPDYFYLHAQDEVKGLYEALGFIINGDPFIEADIKHVRMMLDRRQPPSSTTPDAA